MKITVIVLTTCALMTAAHAQPIQLLQGEFVCPPERPIKKTVDGGIVSCTAVACIGKLVCPPNVAPGMPECYRMPAVDCNTCTRSVSEICLSQEELDKAK